MGLFKMAVKKTQLKKWLEAASTAEAVRLALLAETDRHYLYQLAAPDVPGYGRNCGPDLAARLERAAAVIRQHNTALPTLLRTDLCAVCASCEFAKRCTE